jgi:hypothetical protein
MIEPTTGKYQDGDKCRITGKVCQIPCCGACLAGRDKDIEIEKSMKELFKKE